MFKLFYRHSSISVVHALLPVSVLSNLVDTAHAGTISDSEADESTITPPGAPRVLHLPVIAVAIGILETANGLLTGVPPLVN